MSYIDGYVLPVKTAKKDAYLALAEKMAHIFIDHGALQVVEGWGDDVPRGTHTDFYGAVKAEADETIVFAWVIWPSKAVRDDGNAKIKEDPRAQDMGELPFDMKRPIFGGFTTLMSMGSKI